MSQLVTGEAVTLDLRPARLPSRLVAAALDLTIETVGMGIVLQLLSWASVFADSQFALAIAILTIVAFFVVYPVAFETLWRGLTPGKAALGIRVVRDDGGPIRFRHALSRALLNIVERPGITFGSAAVITSLLSRRGKRLGDLVAGTFVLQERVPRQHVAPVYMPPALAAWAATLDLSRLPDDLALAARGFLGRAAQLRPDARDRMAYDLAAAMASYVTPAPPPGAPPWAFLAAVVAERRRRDASRVGASARYGAGAGPAPWQPAPPSPGWGAAPDRPRWGESAPPTGAPPSVGAAPGFGPPPPDPGAPRLPSPPSPQWGPPPVPPPVPPVPAAPPPMAPAPEAPARAAPLSDPATPNDAGPPSRRRATPRAAPPAPDGAFAPPA
jgi:uncharacterized RDD family membrane protein YckC